MTALILTTHKGQALKIEPSEKPQVFGRAATASFQIEDLTMSKQHFALYFKGGSWWLEDQLSTSGTFLNGELIRKPAPVKSGDEIRAAQTTFKISA